jgi:hypothetical protein
VRSVADSPRLGASSPIVPKGLTCDGAFEARVLSFRNHPVPVSPCFSRIGKFRMT